MLIMRRLNSILKRLDRISRQKRKNKGMAHWIVGLVLVSLIAGCSGSGVDEPICVMRAEYFSVMSGAAFRQSKTVLGSSTCQEDEYVTGGSCLGFDGSGIIIESVSEGIFSNSYECDFAQTSGDLFNSNNEIVGLSVEAECCKK